MKVASYCIHVEIPILVSRKRISCSRYKVPIDFKKAAPPLPPQRRRVAQGRL